MPEIKSTSLEEIFDNSKTIMEEDLSTSMDMGNKYDYESDFNNVFEEHSTLNDVEWNNLDSCSLFFSFCLQGKE